MSNIINSELAEYRRRLTKSTIVASVGLTDFVSDVLIDRIRDALVLAWLDGRLYELKQAREGYTDAKI